MSVVSAAELSEKEFEGLILSEPFNALYGQIEPKACSLIWGPAGSGKSTFTLALANDLAYNGAVVYVSAEEGQGKTLADRINRLQATHPDLFISEYESLERVKAVIRAKKANFCMLDSISVINPASEEVEQFRQWCKHHNIGLHIIAHATKEGQSYKGNSMVGHNTDIVVHVFEGVAKTSKNRYKELSEIPVPFKAEDVKRKAGVKRVNPTLLVRKMESTSGTSGWSKNRADRANQLGMNVKNQIEPWNTDPLLAKEKFNLQGIEFGNWMSEKYRTYYLNGVTNALMILSKVLGIKPAQIGLNGRLRIALGSRGMGGDAAAHYEPEKYPTINLTKPHGNKGSIAHEYGHALDMALGYGIAKDFASGGVSERVTTQKDALERTDAIGAMERLFDALHAESGEGDTFQQTKWYSHFIKKAPAKGYYHRRTEKFARTFETWVYYKMSPEQLEKAQNFLVHATENGSAYSKWPYPDQELINKIDKDMKELIRLAFGTSVKETASLFEQPEVELDKVGEVDKKSRTNPKRRKPTNKLKVSVSKEDARTKPIATLTYMGIAERLITTEWEYKGSDKMFCTADGSSIFIVPEHRIKTFKRPVIGKAAKQMHNEFNHYDADGKNYEITLPTSKKVQEGHAVTIWYGSDKIMEPTDRKGKLNYYVHEFDANKRPVFIWDDVIIIEHLKINGRGILN